MTRVFLKTRTMGPYLTKKILDYDNDLELLQGSNIDNDEDKFYQNLRAQNGGGSAKSEGAVQSEELLSSRNDSPEKSPEKANNAAAQPRSASPLKSSTERSPAKNQARIIEETEQQQQQHTADNEEEAPSKFLTTHTSPSLSAFTFLKTDVSSNSGTLDNGEGSKDRHGRLHDYASEGEAEGEHIDEKNFTSWLSTTEFNSRVSTSENYKTRQSVSRI